MVTAVVVVVIALLIFVGYISMNNAFKINGMYIGVYVCTYVHTYCTCIYSC